MVAEHACGAKAVLGLEPLLPGGGLKVGRRGVARVRLWVDGVTAHAGLDADLGVSAVDELIDQLVALRGLLPESPEASANVGTVHGGTRANVVAGEAGAELGLRFRTAESEREVFAALDSLEPVREGARLHTDRLSYRTAVLPTGLGPRSGQPTHRRTGGAGPEHGAEPAGRHLQRRRRHQCHRRGRTAPPCWPRT